MSARKPAAAPSSGEAASTASVGGAHALALAAADEESEPCVGRGDEQHSEGETGHRLPGPDRCVDVARRPDPRQPARAGEEVAEPEPVVRCLADEADRPRLPPGARERCVERDLEVGEVPGLELLDDDREVPARRLQMLAEEGRDREDDVVRLARELPDELPELRSKIFVRHERIVSPLTVGSGYGRSVATSVRSSSRRLERVDDRGAHDVGGRERRRRSAFRTDDGDAERCDVQHAGVVGAVPDRDATLGAELRYVAGLVLARRDRLRLYAELRCNGHRACRMCPRRAGAARASSRRRRAARERPR